MKTPFKYVVLAAAASSSAAALFAIANSSVTARMPFGIVFSAAASVALVGLAVYDYSRRAKSLVSPAQISRPLIRVATVPANRPVRVVKARQAERIAA